MSTTAFGDYSIEFSHPQEFTLPAEILPTSEAGGPIASATASSHAVHGAAGSILGALNASKCKWSVVSVPPSVSAASISITPTCASSASGVNNNNNEGGGISEAADALFMQSLAAAAASDNNDNASKDVPHLAGEDRLLSNMTPSQHHQHPYNFLRIGMDPKDPLPVGISLPLLVSSIGELASSYGLDNLQEGGGAKAEAFGGMFSRNAILFLAWQRVSQLLAEGVLTKRLATQSRQPSTLGMKRARDEETTNNDVTPSSLSSAYAATSEEGYEAKVSHLRAISALLQGRAASGMHLTSKGIQTALQIPGVNTTSPFAEPLSTTTTSSSTGTDSGDVESALTSLLAPRTITATKATASTTTTHGQPSQFVVKMWNGAVGLTSAESRTQEVPLHMGVNTFGKTTTNGVIGMSDLVPPTATSALPNKMFRLIVKVDSLDDQMAPGIIAVPCGGGAGIRVEGKRWGMGECIPIKEHEVVHVGCGIVFTVRSVAQQ